MTFVETHLKIRSSFQAKLNVFNRFDKFDSKTSINLLHSSFIFQVLFYLDEVISDFLLDFLSNKNELEFSLLK